MPPATPQGTALHLPDSPDGRLHGADCPFPVPVDHVVSCGVITLPERRDVTNGATVKLPVAVYKPPGDAGAAADPVVYLAGGPGSGGLDEVAGLITALDPVLAGRPLITFDQRGTGYGVPRLDCTFSGDSNPVDDAGPSAAYQQALACHDRYVALGVDLSAYDTASNAHDVEDLRITLGYPSWNLFGGSYGTRLALEVMRSYPGGIRSVVLDSVLPPDKDPNSQGGPNFDRVLERIFTRCAALADCNAAYPDLKGMFFDTLDSFDTTPPIVTLSTGERITVHGDDLMQLTFLLSYSAEVIPYLPLFIWEMNTRKLDPLQTLLGAAVKEQSALAEGMYFSVICREAMPFLTPEQFAQANAALPSPRFAQLFGTSELFDICSAWGVPPVDAAERDPVASVLPTLILSGSYDPVTPPTWGEEVANTLTGGHFIEYASAAHGVFLESCGGNLLDGFYGNPSIADPGVACPASATDLTFQTPSSGTSQPGATPLALSTEGVHHFLREALRRYRPWWSFAPR
jgi:pimeloyl-ACP methyl ester carboxylesterase